MSVRKPIVDAGRVPIRALLGTLLAVSALMLAAPRLRFAIELNLANVVALHDSATASRDGWWMADPGVAPETAGRIAYARNEFDDAITHFAHALGRGPVRDVAHFQLAQALARTGKADEALAHWRAARAAPYFLLQGLALRRMHDWSGAETAFAAALAIDPAAATLRAVVGRFYLEWDKPSEARAHLGVALALETRAHERRLLRGELAHSEGRLDDARAEFEGAMRAQPARADAYLRLAEVLFELEQPPEAVRVLRAALRDAAPGIGPHLMLAQRFTAQGEHAQADELLQAAQRLDPHSDEPWLLRAQNALAWNRPDDAADYLQRALQLEPGNAETNAWLARLKAMQAR